MHRLWEQFIECMRDFWMEDNQETRAATCLLELIEQARRDWIYAQDYYNYMAEQELADYAIYMMLATEKKYMYLLKRASKEGVTHLPY